VGFCIAIPIDEKRIDPNDRGAVSWLVAGDDPRQVVYEVRRRLYMGNQRDHDWASLVVYASLPAAFEQQIATFFENSSLAAIETALRRADDLADIPAETSVT